MNQSIISLCVILLIMSVLIITVCVCLLLMDKSCSEPYLDSFLSPVEYISPSSKEASLAVSVPEIHIYFHICMIGAWRQVVSNLLKTCSVSGVLDKCTRCHLVVLGSTDDFSILKRMIVPYPKCKFRFFGHYIARYERTALGIMHSDAVTSLANFKVLYLHSKGVSRPLTVENRGIADWVQFMTYFLLHRNDICIRVLDKVDVCGVSLQQEPSIHLSGNFWWANSNHVRTLESEIGPEYIDPEMWICKNHATVVTLAQSNVNHYHTRYSSVQYVNKPIFLQSNIKLKLESNFFGDIKGICY